MELFNRYLATTPSANTATDGTGSKNDQKKSAPTTQAPVADLMAPVKDELLGEEPGVVQGDLGQKFRVVPGFNNSGGLPIVGKLKPSEKNPDEFDIHINDSYYGEKAKGLDVARLQSAYTDKKTLHLMKFVLDNNLDYNMSINPTQAESDEAASRFDVYAKGPGSTRMAKAYALVKRATEGNFGPGSDNASLVLFNRAFKTSRQMPLSTYWQEGEKNAVGDVLEPVTALDDIKARRNKELASYANKDLVSIGAKYTPRYESRIKGIDKEIKDNVDAAAGLRGDNPELKKINSRIATLTEERTSLITLENQNFQQFKEEQDNLAKINTDAQNKIATLNASISNMEASETQVAADTEKFKLLKEAWIGTNEGDDATYGGWISKGLAYWGNVAPRIPTKNGKPIHMLPGDYIDWVNQNGKYKDFFRRDSMMVNPKVSQLAEIRQISSDQDKLIAPLQTLFMKFDDISKGNWMETNWGKWFDPKYASEENNVFHIMAARRHFVTGGGNPSNYEQEMLLSGIPNPGKVFTIASLNKQRLRTIAYLTLLDHARLMTRSGFAITKSALKYYNQKYQGIMGYEITAADINRHMHIIDTYGIGGKEQGFDPNSSSAERAYQHFEKFHQLIQLEDEQRRAGK